MPMPFHGVLPDDASVNDVFQTTLGQHTLLLNELFEVFQRKSQSKIDLDVYYKFAASYKKNLFVADLVGQLYKSPKGLGFKYNN